MMEINQIWRKWVEVRSVQINTCKAILGGQLLLCGQQLPECVKLQSNSWTAAFVVW